MIGYLTGSVIKEASRNSTLIIDVGGVGYSVSVTSKTYSKCYLSEGPVSLYIHTRVKEDGITLFGFENLVQLKAFEKLISIHGIGAALAVTILSYLAINELQEAVLCNDIKLLSSVPGIGQKTAQRLIIELKSTNFSHDVDSSGMVELADTSSSLNSKQIVRQALTELGYSSMEIRSAIELTDPDLTEEQLMKAALKNLVSQR